MALAMLLEIPGGTQEQYDQFIQKLDLGGKTAPGALFHLAGPTEGGWLILDVWESQDALNQFYQAKLGQVLQEMNFPPVAPKVVPVHNLTRP